MEETAEITLPYSDNSFTIDFVALDYTSQRDGKYAYMLEGFDIDWQFCGPEETHARYTNIDSGDYVFKVVASNKDGLWNEEGASLKITISPPFWQAWWFILLCIAFGITIITLGINFRMRSINKYSRELERCVNEKTSELIQKSAELENELNNRVEFSHAIVHELKTPLPSSLNSSEALIEQPQSEISKKLAMNIYKSVIKLDKRINDLLDFTRSEVGMLNMDCNALDVLKLVDEIYDNWIIEANKKEQKLELDIPASLPDIVVDKDRVEQILSNLISNAIKYNRRKGTVSFKVSAFDSDVVFEIHDEGAGISCENQLKLFKPYQRFTDDAEHFSGLGIGLYYEKTVELQNGKIWVQSEVGHGSSFYVSFPQ